MTRHRSATAVTVATSKPFHHGATEGTEFHGGLYILYLPIMQYQLQTHWTGKDISFTSEVEGFTVNMDSTKDRMADGPSPKRLMLISLLGCTGMDVISLLQKMRVPVEEFSIEGIAPITDEHPKVFASVHLIYRLKGTGIKRDKVEKAINLSQTQFCGVSIMLKKHCPVTWELQIEDS